MIGVAMALMFAFANPLLAALAGLKPHARAITARVVAGSAAAPRRGAIRFAGHDMNPNHHLARPDDLVRDPHLVHRQVHLAAADGGDRGAPAEDRRRPRRRRPQPEGPGPGAGQGQRGAEGRARQGQRDHRPGPRSAPTRSSTRPRTTRSPKPTARRRWREAEIDAVRQPRHAKTCASRCPRWP